MPTVALSVTDLVAIGAVAAAIVAIFQAFLPGIVSNTPDKLRAMVVVVSLPLVALDTYLPAIFVDLATVLGVSIGAMGAHHVITTSGSNNNAAPPTTNGPAA